MQLAHLLLSATLLAAVVAPAPVDAHSLESLEQNLHEKEKFFEIKNVPAPDFTLQDPDGNPLGLADLRGKIVVLHFIYAGCPDVCPLHADLIGRVQEMVIQTPMRDQVPFVTVTTGPDRDTAEEIGRASCRERVCQYV